MRVPARLCVLVTFTLALTAAAGFAWLVRRVTLLARAVPFGLILAESEHKHPPRPADGVASMGLRLASNRVLVQFP